MTELNTKSEAPVSLKTVVSKSIIEELYEVDFEYARDNIDLVCSDIASAFGGDTIVIRSSIISENRVLYSNASDKDMMYKVDASDGDGVKEAILSIFELYSNMLSNYNFSDVVKTRNILIHRAYDGIVLSGVIFTRDVTYNRPYYMVSYNYLTDNIYSDNRRKNKWIARNVSREFLDDDFLTLILAVREIEEFWKTDSGLEIDFAIDSNEQVIIFKVNQMDESKRQPCPMGDKEFIDTKAFAKCNYLDHNNMLSDLLFWNPVEVIGANPRPLDYSIYKELITSGIWRDAISSFGYSDESVELMHRIGNRPYLSLEGIFEAIIPKKISGQLKYKLCEYYKISLNDNRANHKNTEDEVLISSYDFKQDEKRNLLEQKGFTKEEIDQIMDSVFDITNNMINNYEDMCKSDEKDLEKLRDFRRECRKHTPLEENNIMKLYNYIKELMNSIQKNGTPQYIRQVRCKYIAVDICRSLVAKGYFDEEEMKEFFESIPTLPKSFSRDFQMYAQKKISREEFDSKYGHLRLGAYDIRSNWYRKKYFDLHQGNQNFFDIEIENGNNSKTQESLDKRRLAKAIEDIGYNFDVDVLYNFIVEAFKNVELYKYEFTKSLSLVLEVIIRLGELQMIAREDMSYLEIQDLMDYHSRDSYIQIIEARRNMYYAYSYLVLPEFILNLGDIDVVDVNEEQPDFVTKNCIEAEIVNLDENCDADIDGKIVVLTKASQGYEWILTKNIVGIITKYKDSTEYMSKWCKAYGIPAAFGCGEMIFKKMSSVKVIRLDCRNNMIVAI